MAVKVKIVRSVDYLDVSDNGEINFPESKMNLKKIAGENCPGKWDVLFDFRRTQWIISTDDIFSLVEVFLEEKGTFRDKVGLLLFPGVNFDTVYFRELCTNYQDIPIRTFTSYEDAVQWFYDS